MSRLRFLNPLFPVDRWGSLMEYGRRPKKVSSINTSMDSDSYTPYKYKEEKNQGTYGRNKKLINRRIDAVDIRSNIDN